MLPSPHRPIEVVPLALGGVGLLLVLAGAYLIFWPATLIIAGVVALVAAWDLQRPVKR